MGNNFGPDSSFGMARGELTIADVLGKQGYESHMIGRVRACLYARALSPHPSLPESPLHHSAHLPPCAPTCYPHGPRIRAKSHLSTSPESGNTCCQGPLG